MPVKQQLSSVSLLYSHYEDIPDQTLDEADVESYFYHNILDVTKTETRLVRVSKGSNINLFAIKFFKFCDLKAQQRFFPDEEISITKKFQSLRLFLKQFNEKKTDVSTKSKAVSSTKATTRDWLYPVERRSLLTLLSRYKRTH